MNALFILYAIILTFLSWRTWTVPIRAFQRANEPQYTSVRWIAILIASVGTLFYLGMLYGAIICWIKGLGL